MQYVCAILLKGIVGGYILKKRIISTLICIIMIFSTLVGCGQEEDIIETVPNEIVEEETEEVSIHNPMGSLPDSIEPGVYIKATPEMYPETDLSSADTIRMLLIGYIPDDWDKILEHANNYLAGFNTTLEVEFISWADYQDKYSRTLEKSENIDLVFTAPWCYMYAEAAKGIFYTLDSRFAGLYMPLTYKYQTAESWDETTLYGKTVAIPSNVMDTNGKMVAIRQDIADELGIDSLNSWDDYMSYMLTVAENVTPKTGIYALAAEGENNELWDLYRQQFDTFYAMESGYFSMMYRYNGKTPGYEDIEFTYETQMFRDFAKDMKRLAEAGAWSSSAQYGKISDDEAFANLEGASIAWNKSVFTYMREAEKNDGVRCEAYFLSPGHIVPAEAYSNNDMAIMANSHNPERAAMVLDLLKFDTYLNHLFILGIEDEHYTIDSNGFYIELEGAERYPGNYISLSWAIKNRDVIEQGKDSREADILRAMEMYKVACPTVTFVFDDSNVANEMIAVNDILNKYKPGITLGFTPDPDATIDQMLDRCYASGLQKIKDEYKSQYEAWLVTR